MNKTKNQAHLDAMTTALHTAQRAIADLSRDLDAVRRHAEDTRSRTHYSIDEAARALGVSRSTVCRRLLDGTLSSAKVGGRRLIPALELEQAGVA